jgi:hypothetical protein
VAKPTFNQILDVLKRQVLVGKSYLDLAKGLLKADQAILDTAPTFFGLTIDGSLELAQMAVARLYDRTKGTVTVKTMLFQAANERDTFQRGDQQQVTEALLKSVHRVIALQPIVDAIRERRNKWLAHLDSATVRDPAALAANAKLTVPDLERAFKETEEILIELSCLYEGTFGDLRFLGGDDYEIALDWIRSAKCTFIENYEKEFHLPWSGPRPKDCSRNLLHMV